MTLRDFPVIDPFEFRLFRVIGFASVLYLASVNNARSPNDFESENRPRTAGNLR